MIRRLVGRAAQGLLVLWAVTTATFVLIHAAPGGPAVLADPKLSPVERAAIESRLGLDRSLGVQYLRWHGRLLTGDLGDSFLYQTPTLATVLGRLPNTLLLVTTALVVAILIAVPVGLAVGQRPGGPFDRIVGVVNFTALAIPPFWFGIVGILLLAARWRVLPAGGMMTPGMPADLVDRLRHLVLPAAVLALPLAAELIRYLRNAVAATLEASHLPPARARGLAGSAILTRHVLRNALLPLLTAIGLQVPLLVGGAAVTETVFAWPGMGRLGVEAALGRDYPLVMAIALVVAATVVVANFGLDLLAGWADPRIRSRR
ncbi:MAG: ABC transporter permease [Gemmatimonadetes bacterium]|nr:ABC transporter permease [Gemmatimonadota bacterium]